MSLIETESRGFDFLAQFFCECGFIGCDKGIAVIGKSEHGKVDGVKSGFAENLDSIISAEIEKYVAGEQTMDEAIANMDRELKARIGKAEMP